MGNESLPPDIRAQVERQSARTKQGHTGIGGGAQENQIASQRRNAAVNPDALTEEVAPEPAKKAAEKADIVICPNNRCRTDLKDEWNFCAKCGADLMRGGLEKMLGIEWTEKDISDYLFKGYVVRDLKFLGKHTITVKSAQPQDMDQIDDYLLNGDWKKDAKGKSREVSQYYLQQMNSLCATASCLLKFDGDSIGDTMAERVQYLRERGAALVDMASTRVQLFNQALTEHLKKEDTFLGS